MKKLLMYINIALIIILFTSGLTQKKDTNTIIEEKAINQDSIPTIDTTIILTNLNRSNYNGVNLTFNTAQQILYKYFKDKDYLVIDQLKESPLSLSKKDRKKICVEIDTIYFTDFNNNKSADAIVEYWLTPPFASSHCFQPHKAMIIDSDNGYKILNEDFIPDSFVIDSVVMKENHTMIYCYDYDCGNRVLLRKLHVKINKK